MDKMEDSAELKWRKQGHIKKTIKVMDPLSYDFLWNKNVADQIQEVGDALSMHVDGSQLLNSDTKVN